MTRFRIAEAAALLGTSDDTVRRWIDAGRLAASADEAGRQTIAGEALAAAMRDGAASGFGEIGGAYVVAASARNRFAGIVTRVVRDTVMAQVELQAGPHRIVSLLSREAADELGLEPGVLAVASVKATNVGIELPQRP